jgi:replicative DNA helicase
MERAAVDERHGESGPPQNLDAEMSVIGAALLDNEVISDLASVLEPGDFYKPAHQILFSIIIRQAVAGEKIDVITLAAALAREGLMDQVGGKPYLAAIFQSIPSTAHVESHAKLIRECAIRRRLIQAADEIRTESVRGAMDGPGLLDDAERKIFQIAHQAVRSETVNVGDILNETISYLNSIEDNGRGLTGVGTNFYKLDSMTGGFQRGDLVILAARPSMGKTTFALNCALNASREHGATVLFFSLEMGQQQIMTNMLACAEGIDASRLRRGTMTEADHAKLARAGDALYRLPFYIDSSTAVTPMLVRTKARRVKARVGRLDLVVVDYLQLMNVPGAENRQQEIAAISRALKALARELECPVMALSQLNRALESRKDHRPQLSDLRESGAIEQDADLIVFLHREDYYKDSGEGEAAEMRDRGKKTEIIVGKHRNGPTGKLDLVFLPQYLQFQNMAMGVE